MQYDRWGDFSKKFALAVVFFLQFLLYEVIMEIPYTHWNLWKCLTLIGEAEISMLDI